MTGAAGKVCPKCEYIRTGEEPNPEYECPKCGIVYAKVEAAMARQNAEESGANGDESIWTPSEYATEVDDEFAEPKIFARKGRIGRLRYIAYSVGIYFVMLPLFGIAMAMMMGLGEAGVVGGSVLLVIAYVAVAVFFIVWTVRRINDFNMNGWFVLLFMFVGIVLWFIPGTKGTNDYGPQPTPNSTGVKVMSIGVCVLIPLIGILAAIAIPAYQDYAMRAQIQMESQSQ